jgi:hypothetical protein
MEELITTAFHEAAFLLQMRNLAVFQGTATAGVRCQP